LQKTNYNIAKKYEKRTKKMNYPNFATYVDTFPLNFYINPMESFVKKFIMLLTLLNIAVFAQDTFTDSRDGKKYKTVKIGNQIWMAENLNFDAPDSKCYDNSQENCAKYGRLYNWETAMKICPNGWHLPSYEEWTTLTDFVGGAKTAGTKLKAKSGWNKEGRTKLKAKSGCNKDGNGTDDFGFSALPGGYCYGSSFDNVGGDGNWWCASEYGSDIAYGWGMYYCYEYVDWYYDGKDSLFSVRCLQDLGEAHR